MRKILIILGAIIAQCIIALIVIAIIPEPAPLSIEELACMDAGFSVEPLNVQDCAELLTLEKNVLRLKREIKKLEKLLNPGIDI